MCYGKGRGVRAGDACPWFSGCIEMSSESAMAVGCQRRQVHRACCTRSGACGSWTGLCAYSNIVVALHCLWYGWKERGHVGERDGGATRAQTDASRGCRGGSGRVGERRAATSGSGGICECNGRRLRVWGGDERRRCRKRRVEPWPLVEVSAVVIERGRQRCDYGAGEKGKEVQREAGRRFPAALILILQMVRHWLGTKNWWENT
ncbi:hypothetical protein DFH08DRAFT_824439 [Mycena albidolilacea]|uniref:Uncharacterized protein n=1 Tax=Mycena albidolilacea TaxID=1033008 RepID=A0AAD6Z425_9AGAR|nr:hypothetical protein DFH08DRAFT_824439 [Mycena albidolilacea]